MASAGLCDKKEPKHAKSPKKAADSKLEVKTPAPTPDSLAVPAQDPIAATPQASKAKSASPKPKKEIKSKTLSKNSSNSKPVPQDIVDGNVNVSKLIGRFDPSKIPAPVPEPKPAPVVQDPVAVINAKRERVSAINWEEYDSKLGQK